MNITPYPKNLETAVNWDYKFWNTQPVTKVNESVILEKEFTLQEEKIEKLQDTPVKNEQGLLVSAPAACSLSLSEKNEQLQETLPENFAWVNYDLSKESDKEKISVFLNKFYGMDVNGEFSRQYNANYLEWLISDKQYIALGVEHKGTLMGFIYGHVTKTQVNKRQLDLVECSLLCIHPKLRYKGLTPKLVTELKRQFTVLGYKYGTFSTVNYLSMPFCSVVAHNRIISAKILLETGFVKLDETITLDAVKKTSKLPDEPTVDGFKKMEESHVDQAFDLFNQYMKKYNFHPIFSKDQFKTEFYNNKFITTYIIENKKGEVLDLVSYYTLPSLVLNKNEKYKTIKRGYLYYYTCVNTTPYKLLQNILIIGKKFGVDVFTALDNMENMYVLKELGFDESPTTYHEYMFNLKIPALQNFQVAKVFL